MAKYIFEILPVGLCSSVCPNQKSQRDVHRQKRDKLYGALHSPTHSLYVSLCLSISLSLSLSFSLSLALSHSRPHM